ncbi:hypothetical protein FXO37_35298 [Capsicum annuum]|nr:hypothetical protein FXO37_35298 [Capsicum annuum]
MKLLALLKVQKIMLMVCWEDVLLEASDADLKDKPTLADIQRWAVNIWKNAFGEWWLKHPKIHLEWWFPTAGCCTRRKNSIWIRAMRLPLHTWTEKFFKGIGNYCGRWLETEEETSFKKYLKLARIRIKGDRDLVPKEVKITDNGLTFVIPIWNTNHDDSQWGRNRESFWTFGQRNPIWRRKIGYKILS